MDDWKMVLGLLVVLVTTTDGTTKAQSHKEHTKTRTQRTIKGTKTIKPDLGPPRMLT